MARDKKDYEYLNIAMLGHKHIPSREGGIEIVVKELSVRLVKMGHRVTCYNRKGHHISGREFDIKECKEYKGIKLVSVPTINCKGLAAITSSVLSSIVTAFGKYDIVHIHAEGPAFMCWLPKLMGKKVIVTIHGLDWQRTKWGKFARAYLIFGEKSAVRYADEIIVLSKGVQKYFKERYGRNTEFIPNGVNIPKKIEADRITKKWKLKKDDYILFLGRIVPEKGLEYLISAFKDVETNKKLVIAGGSSDTDKFFKKLQKMGNQDYRIIFTGFVQGKLLEELYSNAYIYTLPSDLEGMPLSLLEGMSYGNCCLVSDIEECVSVVQDKAMIFKKSNIEDLREKLQMACDNENLVRYYKRVAADYICEKYSWDDMANGTLEVYKKFCYNTNLVKR